MLQWNFKSDFIGKAEVIDERNNKPYIVNLYKDGYAVLGCFEYTQNNKRYYQVTLFWLDLEHLINCLKDNVYHAIKFTFSAEWYNDHLQRARRYVGAIVRHGIDVEIKSSKINKKYYEVKGE